MNRMIDPRRQTVSILDNDPIATLTLRGRTLRGKNRIARGGTKWQVLARGPSGTMFVRSEQVGFRECFWMRDLSDPHVEIIDAFELPTPNPTERGV